MIYILKKILRFIIVQYRNSKSEIALSATVSIDCKLGKNTKIFSNCKLGNCSIGSYSYIGYNSNFANTSIGSFSSIGPEVLCGLGDHPLNFISTYPGFYTNKRSGATWFGVNNEFVDNKPVNIGSDVWIGARAIILGGVNIGHGSVIAAGSIINKDVPPYAVVAGIPGKIIKFRFDEGLIKTLLELEWWNESENNLQKVAKYALEPEKFANKLKLLKI